MIQNGLGETRVRPPMGQRSAKDDTADWALTRLWMQTCITGDEEAKDALFLAQGRGMAGMYAYERFLAQRTVRRERGAQATTQEGGA
jgi:hypothetical protein